MKVCIRKQEDYSQKTVNMTVGRMLDELGGDRDLKPGMKVLIKPNLLAARPPEAAATTHPAILMAVAKYVRAHGIDKIVIADSPGGMYNASVMRKTYTVCGLDILREIAELNYDTSSVERKGFTLLTPVSEADYIINCPKLKTHGLAVMTAGVKNLFGCIPGLKKPEVHCLKPTAESFSEYLIRLCECVKPQITLLDAIECMEGNGPGGGTVKHGGYLIASRSPYALDETAAFFMGLKPSMAPVLQAARCAGKMNEPVERIGDELIPADPPFVLPDAITRQGSRFAFMRVFKGFCGKRKTYPSVILERCIGCGKCAESCPQHLIKIVDHKAQMDKNGCISCYCCQEMCPAHAIEARRK